MTFIEKCSLCTESPDNIDDYVDLWHLNYHNEESLSSYLGFTEEEYAKWVIDPSYLNVVIQRKRDLIFKGDNKNES